MSGIQRGVVRVVVAGGTGFVGRQLVTSLRERGDDVVVLTRGEASWPAAAPGCPGAGSVETVRWLPEQEGEWMAVVDGADAVVHLAGAGLLDERWTPARRELLRTSRVRSTELLAQAMVRADKPPRTFVSGSAIGYYGTKTGDTVLDERAPRGDDFLAELVSDWEMAAAPALAAGVRVCHPRLGLVLGRGGGMLGRMLPLFRAFVGGPLGHGRQYVPWIHMRDATRAIEHAIAREDLSGPFNTTSPEPVTMNDFCASLASVLRRPCAMRVPDLALKMALGAGAEVVLTGQRAVPKRLVEDQFAFVFPDLSSALADLT